MIAVIAALQAAAHVVAPLLLSILCALLLARPVRWLAGLGIPRLCASALVVGLSVVLFGFLLNAIWQPARHWLETAPTTMIALEGKMRPLQSLFQELDQVACEAQRFAGAGTPSPTRPVSVGLPISAFSIVPGAVAALATSLSFVFLLLALGPRCLDRFQESLDASQLRRAVSLIETIGADVSRYLATRVIAGLVSGTVTMLLVQAFGVPDALLWGAMAALFSVVPYVGAIATLAVLTVVGLVTFQSLPPVLALSGFLLLMQMLEGRYIQPLLLGRRLELNTVIVVLAIWLFGALWGFAGLILAVPLLLSLRALASHMDALRLVLPLIGPLSAPMPSKIAVRASSRQSMPWGRRCLMLALSLLPMGCISLPDPDLSALAPAPGHMPQVAGAKGPLSPSRSAALLRRLGLESAGAGALNRHLAIEQVVAGTPLYAGNSSAVLQDSFQTFPALFAAIRSASRFIYLEYYIFDDIEWQGTRLDQLLISKSNSGVEVAVIYDSVGSLGTSNEFLNSLRAAGIRLLPFNPVNPLNARHHWSLNNRDHRKLLVADNRIAIVGGVNMATDYESGPSGTLSPGTTTDSEQRPYWRDTDIEIAGPAVSELSRLFRDHWSQQGGSSLADIDPTLDTETEGSEVVHVLASSPGSSLLPLYYATVLSAIDAAQRSVWITASYFVPTHQEKVALALAARRGVDVRLLLPSQSDSAASLAVQRSSYARLLHAGVRIYERDGVILHSKSIVVDGVWSVIGSSNFDHRSVLFNDEVDAVVLGSATALELERLFRSDLERGHAIELASWRHRPMLERLREVLWSTCTALL